jgi:two-component system sensor histidine kinase YesM
VGDLDGLLDACAQVMDRLLSATVRSALDSGHTDMSGIYSILYDTASPLLNDAPFPP